jgi:hypothetical protein
MNFADLLGPAVTTASMRCAGVAPDQYVAVAYSS